MGRDIHLAKTRGFILFESDSSLFWAEALNCGTAMVMEWGHGVKDCQSVIRGYGLRLRPLDGSSRALCVWGPGRTWWWWMLADVDG